MYDKYDICPAEELNFWDYEREDIEEEVTDKE
jgi:hypothetical protein